MDLLKYAHQWVLLDELQRVGVQVVFINQPEVSQDPQGQLFLGMQGLFAEYERAMITERLRRGSCIGCARVNWSILIPLTAIVIGPSAKPTASVGR